MKKITIHFTVNHEPVTVEVEPNHRLIDVQCGFCIPGMILTAEAFLKKNPNPTRDEVKLAISGNLCRCTGYAKINDAVLLAAARMRGEEAEA